MRLCLILAAIRHVAFESHPSSEFGLHLRLLTLFDSAAVLDCTGPLDKKTLAWEAGPSGAKPSLGAVRGA